MTTAVGTYYDRCTKAVLNMKKLINLQKVFKYTYTQHVLFETPGTCLGDTEVIPNCAVTLLQQLQQSLTRFFPVSLVGTLTFAVCRSDF